MRRGRGVLAVAALALTLALIATAGGRAAFAEPEGQGRDEAAAVHGEEHGQEHGEEAEPETPPLKPGKLLLQFVNFGILVGILGWFGGRAANKALRARHDQLKADLASAAEARAAAEERLRRQEARLASLEQEIAAMRAGIKQEAEAEKARLIAAAEDRARRIREETTFMLDQQVKEAEAQLKREAAEASVKVAEELLRRGLDGQDQQRMVETFVREVASGDGVPASPPPGDGSGGPRPAPRSQV